MDKNRITRPTRPDDPPPGSSIMGHSSVTSSGPSGPAPARCSAVRSRAQRRDCMFGTWMKLALDTSMLALETQQVIGLRFLKLTLGGPAASREANRMMAEKMIAFGEAAAKVATGSTAGSVVKGYRKKVRANRRRLTK